MRGDGLQGAQGRVGAEEPRLHDRHGPGGAHAGQGRGQRNPAGLLECDELDQKSGPIDFIDFRSC